MKNMLVEERRGLRRGCTRQPEVLVRAEEGRDLRVVGEVGEEVAEDGGVFDGHCCALGSVWLLEGKSVSGTWEMGDGEMGGREEGEEERWENVRAWGDTRRRGERRVPTCGPTTRGVCDPSDAKVYTLELA